LSATTWSLPDPRIPRRISEAYHHCWRISGAGKSWVIHAAPDRRREVAMGIIAWIILGAIAGWLTNMLMGGGGGVIATVILGIVGAVVGGYLAGTVLGVADVTGINPESIVVSVIGGVVVVAVYRLVMGRRAAV
jgi:uncharacterized membrane protein YeaQ/YmgE (transglycosylase-associated protein family)